MFIDVTKYPNVQAAFDIAVPKGLPVYFRPGEHDADGLTVPSGVDLVGAGRKSRVTGHISFAGNGETSVSKLTFADKVTLSGLRFSDWSNVRFEDQLEFVPSVRVPGQSAAFCHYNKFSACWFRGVEGEDGIVDPIVSYGINNFNWFDGCQIKPHPNSALGGISILADPMGGSKAAGGWAVTNVSIEAWQDGAYKPFLNISGNGHTFKRMWLERRTGSALTWADQVGVRFNTDSRHCYFGRTTMNAAFGSWPQNDDYHVQNLGRFNKIQNRRSDRDVWDEDGIVAPVGNPSWQTQEAFEAAGGTVPPEPDHYGG